MATKITGTNTAAAPGITGDDTDTGLFYGTNEIGFSTGGTSRLTLDSSGYLNVPDNGKIRLGTGSDLSLYHDGSHSYIKDAGTGQLRLQTSLFSVENAGGTENILSGTADGAVNLYYDGSKKFETTSAGATVSGHLTVKGDVFFDNQSYAGSDLLWDESDSTLEFADSVKANFGAGDDLQIYHHPGSTESRVWHTNGSGWLNLRGDAIKLGTHTDTETYLTCSHNGGVEIYHDNSKKFETTSTGATLTGNLKLTAGSGTDTKIHTANAAGIIYQADQNGHKFQTWDNSAWQTALHIEDDGDIMVERNDIVVSGSGKGILLGGTAAANKLNDYEEGTWTPVDTDGNVGLSISGAYYTKIGRLVVARISQLTFSSNSDSSSITIGGLPFTINTNAYASGGGHLNNDAQAYKLLGSKGNNYFWVYPNGSTSGSTWSQVSGSIMYGIMLIYEAGL